MQAKPVSGIGASAYHADVRDIFWEIVKRVTGQTVREYFAENIEKPMGWNISITALNLISGGCSVEPQVHQVCGTDHYLERVLGWFTNSR